MTSQKLTPKKIFCLSQLAEKDCTAIAIAQAAKEAGLNKTVWGSIEWADAPMREMRKAGLVEHTGEKENAAHIHRITAPGREALQAAKEEI